MALSSPEILQFVIAKVRPGARMAVDHYYAHKAMLQEWAAAGLAAQVTDPAETVPDGAPGNTNHPIIGQDVLNAIAAAGEYCQQCDANGGALLSILLKVAGQGQ